MNGGISNTGNLTPYTLTLAGSGSGGITLPTAITDGGVVGTTALAVNSSGTGAMTLSGANTFTGGATITAGTTRINVASVGSVGSITSSAFGRGALALNGGTVSSGNTTARTVLNPVTVGGNITLGDATNSGALTFSAATDLGGASRQLTVASAVSFGGVMSNGGLTKEGSGTLTLNAANTFTGNTLINAGTLVLGASASLSSASVQIASGAILDATAGGFSIASGKSFGGDGTATGNLSFAAGANFLFSTTAILDVNGNVTFGGFSTSNLTGLSGATPAGVYTLLNSIGGSISQANVSNIGVGNAADLGGGKLAYFDFTNGDLALNVSAVPEPSSFALFGGVAALGFASMRRRRLR